MVLLARPATNLDLHAELARLKLEHDAVILAHYYQSGDIQDVADFIGDSLELARKAASCTQRTIVFCGVHFMAESAKILAPERTVLLPDMEAGCSLADSAPAEAFAAFCAQHPDHVVVTYVNSSAAVKALSDYCVTSSNAVAVVRSIPKHQPIIFAPDQYLGQWVSEQTGRELLLWEGSCEVHEQFSAQAIAQLAQQYPQAQVLVHPECPRPVRALAQVVGSTKTLLQAVREGKPNGTYIVVTEPGIIHQMKKAAPLATFLEAPAQALGKNEQGSCISCNTCPHMRRNTLEKLVLCLKRQSPQITLDPQLIARARLPIDRMLAVG